MGSSESWLQHTSVLDQGTTNPFDGQDQKCTSLQAVKEQSNESSSRYVVQIDEKLQRQKFLLMDDLETVRTVHHAYETWSNQPSDIPKIGSDICYKNINGH